MRKMICVSFNPYLDLDLIKNKNDWWSKNIMFADPNDNDMDIVCDDLLPFIQKEYEQSKNEIINTKWVSISDAKPYYEQIKYDLVLVNFNSRWIEDTIYVLLENNKTIALIVGEFGWKQIVKEIKKK